MSRTKWHPTPPPPPSPKILHFPLTRRSRRKPPNSTAVHSRRRNPSILHFTPGENVGLLSSNQEDGLVDRRGRVECGGRPINELEKEKWMFQADILRAECNLMRMEREFALKKLERNKTQMEQTLRSAVHTLVTGKNKIFEGKNEKAVLEKEIEDLSKKLEQLQNSTSIKDNEFPKSSHFDKKACKLQHRIEKLGGLSDEKRPSELHEESSLFSDETNRIVKQTSVFPKIENKSSEELILNEDNNRCSGRCKSIVRRIVEQVRADTEQWSQMQEMLGQVRSEMEQLQASRDFWKNQAHGSDYEIQSLKNDVDEWREKASCYEIKVNDLQLELSSLQDELQKLKAESNLGQNSNKIKMIQGPTRKQHEKEKHAFSYHKNGNEHSYGEVCAKGETNIEETKARTPAKDLSSISLARHLSNEKRMILGRPKEKCYGSEKRCMHEEELSFEGRVKIYSKRLPLKDVGNLS